MGQVVGKVSDIFRCNLRAIQTGGSKANTILAADEVWLVDTTNSLTNSLSGNCDAYIVGDGSTKASALEVRKNEKHFTNVLSHDVLTTYNPNAKNISSNNVWAAGTRTNNQSIFVPVVGGDIVQITSNSSRGVIYALLKNNTPIGTDVPFSDSAQGRVTMSANEKRTIVIPADVNLLYVLKIATSDYLPSQIKITRTNDVAANKEIANIDYEINGEAHNKTIYYRQGYVNILNRKFVVSSDLSTRVVSTLIDGNFKVKTNSGYKIRSICAFDNVPFNEGDFLGGIMNTITAEGEAFTINDSECSFINSHQHAVITFCKEDDSAELSPTDDIVDYIIDDFVSLNDRIEESKNSYHSVNKVLFMGDSINYGLASYFNGELSGVRVVTTNRISDYFARYGNYQVDNIAARGTGYVADTRNLGNGWEKAQVTDYSNYNLVCICLGINDYIQHVSIGTIADNEEGTLIGNMMRVIGKIMTDNPLCKIVIYSPYNSWGQYCDDPNSEYQADTLYGDESTDYALGYAIRGHTLTDYITAIDSVCAAYHIQHIKLSESGMINKANIKKVLADGLHPIVDVRPMLAAELFGRKMYD